MKKFLLGLGILALGVACRASGANMHDTSACTGKDCADCAAMAKEGMDCSSEAACQEKCEGEAKVCPVTGKSIE